ncbi:NAD-dependent epimerase/dehydratase family protein [Candidatus Pelagibacter sp.]|nr:NAD-dependent epimerase/dehydratase family protein [Candidatus Pelagibacter sp.]
MKILITGSAGFIGFHLAKQLCHKKHKVFGIDNLDDYYDVLLKKKRLNILKKEYKNFLFQKIDIRSKKLEKFIKKNKIKIIIHLAAQPGVRFSVEKPKKYFSINVEGFFNILEASKKNKIKHLMFASSSSVYGDPKKLPMTEKASDTDKPLSFYAATKKSNEVMAHAYSNIYKIPITCLRFFTVYGPWGRPDMFFYKFLKAAFNKKLFYTFNNGKHLRDFTFIDDIVLLIEKIILKQNKTTIPYQVFNLGQGKPIMLNSLIKNIERALGFVVKKKNRKKQKGDVESTYASSQEIIKKTNYGKFTKIELGVQKYINWFRENNK